MAINLVRKPSETPNINNYDDYRMFRYATGGYNGVVEKYGNECDYEISGSDFKIKSGEIVIDGVQARIDASGVNITVDTVNGVEHYTIYCEINLNLIDNQKVEIKSIKSTVSYPEVEKGDDLTENQTGISRLELYRFETNNGAISNVQKKFEIIDYGKSKYSEISNIAIFADEDFSKGTIDERLITRRIFSISLGLIDNATHDIDFSHPASNKLGVTLRFSGYTYTGNFFFNTPAAVASDCSFFIGDEYVTLALNFNSKTLKITRTGSSPATLNIMISIFS